MTDIILYPMALYPPKGDMLIVQDEKEHFEALASWEEKPVAAEILAREPLDLVAAVAVDAPDGDDAFEHDDGPETFDATGSPIKRGPGRPRKVVP